MFDSVKRELRSEPTLRWAVVVAGVSIGLLMVLVMAKSDSVGSPSTPASAKNFTIERPDFSVPTPAAEEPNASDVQSAAGKGSQAFPGKAFAGFPTVQNPQAQPSESGTSASGETPPGKDSPDAAGAPADVSEGISEEGAKAADSTDNAGTEVSTASAEPPAAQDSPAVPVQEGDSATATPPSAPIVSVEPEPQLVGPTKLLPEFPGARFLPDASEVVGDSMFGDAVFDNDSLKEAVKAVITSEWGDLSLAGADVFAVPNALDALSFYRSRLGVSNWTLYADVEGASSALMYVLNDQTLVILTLESRQMRLFDQESEGVAVLLFDIA